MEIEIDKSLDRMEKLGSGGFGNVYRFVDGKGKEYAVKCCPMGNEGVPHPLEISVMTTIQHPNINRAIWVHCEKNKIYIIQDLAKCDLSKIVRKDKSGEKIDKDTVKKWLYGLVSAVECLHTQGLVHGDIKASNVLVFKDGSVRLSDFSLIAKLPKDKKFTHKVGTVSHRPIENHLGKGWDYSLDIWSLGVTFYEIMYGELPFPYQGKGGVKDHLTDRAVNCLLDFGENGPTKQSYNHVSTKYQYLKFKLPDAYKHDPYGLNSLLIKMLSLQPEKRPNIYEIMNHPYFAKMQKVNCVLLETEYNNKLNRSRINSINSLCLQMNVDEDVRNLTVDLYARTENMDKDKELRMQGCLYIASKVLRRRPPQGMLPPHPRIKSIEKKICHFLGYRLHHSKLNK